MLSVQMGRARESQEELRSVRVASSIRHGQNASASVFSDEVLIVELSSVDRMTACVWFSRLGMRQQMTFTINSRQALTCAISCCDIAALGHEIRDDAVKRTVEVMEILPLFPFLKSTTHGHACEVMSLKPREREGGRRGREGGEEGSHGLTCAESSEILSGSRVGVLEEFEGHPAHCGMWDGSGLGKERSA